jgi:thiol-disulfide isomerase/thioredoxin
MANGESGRTNGGRTIQARITALAGLVVIVGAAAVILLAAGILGGQGGGTTETGIKIEGVTILDPPPAPSLGELSVEAKVGSLAPDFEISDFDGARHRLSEYRGKPVYVNFWATWCIPCQRELPEIQELMDRHEDDLAIITVNRAEPLNRAEAFLDNVEKLNGEPGISFTVDGMDPDDTLYDAYRGLGMPVSVFIDSNGKVVKVFNGLIDLEIMEESVAEAVDSARIAEDGGTSSGGS